MPDQPGTGLRVDLELKDRHLLVSTDGENLGTYPLSQTMVERVTGDRFRLTIGNEILEFSADDALGFSYDAMPAMSGTMTHRPASWREFWRRNRPSATQRMIPTARPVAMGPAVEAEDRSDLSETPVEAGSEVAAEAADEPTVAFADLTLDHKIDRESELVTSHEQVVGPTDRTSESDDTEAERQGSDPVASETAVEELAQQVVVDPTDPSLKYNAEQPDEFRTGGVRGDESVDSHPEAGVTLDSPTVESSPLAEPMSPATEASPLPAMAELFEEVPTVAPVTVEEGAVEECRGRRSDGSPCGSVAINASGFCFAHDPDLAGERRLMTERVNQTARRARATDPDLEALVVRLERAVADVQDGTLDPQQALAMASLVQAMCDTIGVNRRRD